MKRNIDIQVFKEVLLYTQQYFQLKINSLKKSEEILMALVDETLRQLEHDIPPINIVFDYVDIHNLVWPISETLDPVVASKKVRRHKSKLIEIVLPDSSLTEYLKEQGVENRLTFESDDSKGGAGATTNMWLGIDEGNTHTNSTTTNIAIYRATQIKSPSFGLSQ